MEETMKTIKHFLAILLCISLCLSLTQAQPAPDKRQDAQTTNTIAQDVLIIIQQEQVRFTAQKAVAEMQLQIFDQAGQIVYDSGAVTGPELTWVLRQANGEAVKSGLYAYTLSVKEAGAADARVRRGHFIVDRAKERDGQTDRLWITSQNEGGVGTELTVARNEGETVAGARVTSERKGAQAAEGERDGARESKNENNAAAAAAAISGTIGRIAKFISATDLGNSVMTELNGNIGIGTTNPTSKLEIAAQDGLKINGHQPFLSLRDTNAGGRRSYLQGVDGDLVFIPNNFAGHSAGMVLRDSNKTGSRLEIFGQDGLSITGFQPFLTLRDTNTGGARSILAGGAGDFGFYPNSFIGGSPAVLIKNFSGNVGIGTPAPQAKLDVAGTTRTNTLQITGGADFAENFEVNLEKADNEAMTAQVEAGMVVSLDPASPGKLSLSAQAYDRRVAGVISGAGGVKPGMVMSQEGTLADGKYPVALSGRVYCWGDASQGAIEVGDLLTTSSTPGHAMKATDAAKAQGAIIGKAMTGLKEGKGLVLVLVTLQ
jgi:hypothetical protein